MSNTDIETGIPYLKKEVITQNNCWFEIKRGGDNRINWIAESIFAKDNESKLFTYIVKH